MPRSRLAPITATPRGSKNAFIEAVAAACDLVAAFASNAGVTDSESDTWRTPRSFTVVMAKPESRNTSSMRRLPAST